METTKPKYIQNKNQVNLKLPLSENTELTKYDSENKKHFFNLMSNEYEFKHTVCENGYAVATINAIPISIFEN